MKRFIGHTKNRRFISFWTIILISLLTYFSCQEQTLDMPPQTYHAELTPLNEQISGTSPTGTAMLQMSGDSLMISISLQDLPPSMMHLQHFHGFVDGQDASCATMMQDTNNDGIIDLLETEAVSGITLVPFHKNPASLQIKSDTYPIAGDDGSVSYSQTVSVSELESNLANTHNIDSLLLEHRVVYIHGISSDISLPETVQSLPEVPAHVTLPIACGELELVE